MILSVGPEISCHHLRLASLEERQFAISDVPDGVVPQLYIVPQITDLNSFLTEISSHGWDTQGWTHLNLNFIRAAAGWLVC